ncbi:MAG: deaminase [Ilumatobacteraceae bacterium]
MTPDDQGRPGTPPARRLLPRAGVHGGEPGQLPRSPGRGDPGEGRRVIATGYNGTPEGLANCLDGGCVRCSDRDQFESGTGYDLCICVHAEANALLTAGRYGASTDATTVYTTDQPCFSCSKELIQAGVEKVYYARSWRPDPRVADDYRTLQTRLQAEHVPTEYEIVSL